MPAGGRGRGGRLRRTQRDERLLGSCSRRRAWSARGSASGTITSKFAARRRRRAPPTASRAASASARRSGRRRPPGARRACTLRRRVGRPRLRRSPFPVASAPRRRRVAVPSCTWSSRPTTVSQRSFVRSSSATCARAKEWTGARRRARAGARLRAATQRHRPGKRGERRARRSSTRRPPRGRVASERVARAGGVPGRHRPRTRSRAGARSPPRRERVLMPALRLTSRSRPRRSAMCAQSQIAIQST